MRLWAITFLAGIFSVQQLSTLPDIRWLFVLFPLTLIFLCLTVKPLQWCQPTGANRTVVIGLAGLIFGFAWAVTHAHWMMGQRLLPQYEGVDLVVEGMVASLPVTTVSKKSTTGFGRQRLRFEFTPTKIISPDNIAFSHFPGRIRLSWYSPAVMLEAGSFWRFNIRLKRPYGLNNPGSFNYANWLYLKRIQAQGYVRNNDENQQIKDNTSSFFFAKKVLKLRQYLLHKLTADMDVGANTGLIRALTQALLLGYRDGLKAQHWRTFQRTGTVHLMAISGLHIGLVAGLMYFLASFLWRLSGRGCLLIPAPQFAAIMALLAATLYAMLAGFTIPTQRALLMLSVAMLHIVLKRTPLATSKTIALSLILVLLFDPLAVLAQGFWLSFLAVSLIIFFVRHPFDAVEQDEKRVSTLSAARQFVHKLLATVLQFGRIQWALTLAMFPLILYFYQSSSLLSPLANFIAIPVMSLAIVPLMFTATLFLFLNTAVANLFFRMVDIIYTLLWQVLETLANGAFATLELSIGSGWWLLSCFLAVLLWLTARGMPMRGLAVILVLPVFFYSPKELAHGEALVTVLDVGQGLSVVVQTQAHTVVFDTGPRYSSNFDTGRAVVTPYLRQMQRSVIDTLVISHGDNDHIGGLKSVVELLSVKRILSSIPGELHRELQQQLLLHSAEKSVTVSACLQGQHWQYDGVQFKMLSPIEIIEAENGHDENNQSCVLKVVTQSGSVLIAGDIERETESYLYHKMPRQLRSEVLVVPHHGSNTSSLAGFIQTVSPQYAVFPVGYKNRYRLPNKKVMYRYQQSTQARLLQTYATGALRFYFQRTRLQQPESYRLLHQRYWQTTINE